MIKHLNSQNPLMYDSIKHLGRRVGVNADGIKINIAEAAMIFKSSISDNLL